MDRDRQKKTKKRPATDLPPLPPQAAADLEHQLARLAEAVAAGADLETLKSQLASRPKDPAWDLHLMAGLAALADPVIPPLLAALFGASKDKLRRKNLKKTLHLLQTRGVPVPPDLLPREEASLGVPRPGTALVHVSPIFGNGEAYVILEGPPEILGGNLLVARVSDIEGFKEAHLLTLKRRELAEFWEHFKTQGLEHWFAPDPAVAVHLLEEAYQKEPAVSAASRYSSLRDKIFAHWGNPESAPDLEALLPPAAAGEQHRLLEQAHRLAFDPLFLSWLPSPEEIAPWVIKFQEVEQSPLVLSDQQKQVRTDSLLDEATRALFAPATRPTWHRRLLLSAYFLDLDGRREDAQALAAAARDLEQGQTLLAGENPFLKSLVQYALRLAWAREQKPGKPEDSSVLVAPPSESLLIRR